MCFAVGMITLGLVSLVVGTLVWTGRYKRWYLHEGDPLYSPKEIFYVYIPLGFTLLSWGGAAFLSAHEVRQTAFWGVVFPLGIAVAVLLFWLPDWIKPPWVRWLEKNHEDILLLLLREARKTPNWGQQVATQKGLEEWVAEVRRKHGL